MKNPKEDIRNHIYQYMNRIKHRGKVGLIIAIQDCLDIFEKKNKVIHILAK